MNGAFGCFMAGLVDYAGLFPPARLDMESAVGEYRNHGDQVAAWMLGRFIVPAGRLDEMVGALPTGFADRQPWELSVIVGGGGQPDVVLKELPAQLATIARIEAEHVGRLTAPALEMSLPLLASDALQVFLDDLKAVMTAGRSKGRQLFLEVPAALHGQDDPEYLAAIKGAGRSGLTVGAKFRCGGLTPEAFPPVERLAGLIAACARLDLPLKFTAGLHHPVRHQAEQPAVMMHGFLNVFGAGMLAGVGHGEDTLVACLDETDAAAFDFTAEGFRWRDHLVLTADVARLRSTRLMGFGSCSFNEPHDDLKELGLPVAGEGKST